MRDRDLVPRRPEDEGRDIIVMRIGAHAAKHMRLCSEVLVNDRRGEVERIDIEAGEIWVLLDA